MNGQYLKLEFDKLFDFLNLSLQNAILGCYTWEKKENFQGTTLGIEQLQSF